MRPHYAVVGHVEWLDFACLPRHPKAGEIMTAGDFWQDVGGGGVVAAVQLARLGGQVHFFTALGNDELGRRAERRLRELGLQVWVGWRDQPTRRAFTLFDDAGERTIIVMGPRLAPYGDDPLPWEQLESCQGVFVTAGDGAALRLARRAQAVVATSRVLADVLASGLVPDAVVGSSRDPREGFTPESLPPACRLGVLTEGERGGRFWGVDRQERRFPPVPLSAPPVDSYGCGDSFAAGLTWGLGARLGPTEALHLAARCGAACLTGRGPFSGQLSGPP